MQAGNDGVGVAFAVKVKVAVWVNGGCRSGRARRGWRSGEPRVLAGVVVAVNGGLIVGGLSRKTYTEPWSVFDPLRDRFEQPNRQAGCPGSKSSRISQWNNRTGREQRNAGEPESFAVPEGENSIRDRGRTSKPWCRWGHRSKPARAHRSGQPTDRNLGCSRHPKQRVGANLRCSRSTNPRRTSYEEIRCSTVAGVSRTPACTKQNIVQSHRHGEAEVVVTCYKLTIELGAVGGVRPIGARFHEHIGCFFARAVRTETKRSPGDTVQGGRRQLALSAAPSWNPSVTSLATSFAACVSTLVSPPADTWKT